MEQEQEDRRPTDSDVPTKKQRSNRPRLPPLQNPDNMNGLPANQVNQRMVDFEQQQAYDINEQQQAGKRRKRRTKRITSKKSRKSRRKYRR